jgi:hypothetical protein
MHASACKRFCLLFGLLGLLALAARAQTVVDCDAARATCTAQCGQGTVDFKCEVASGNAASSCSCVNGGTANPPGNGASPTHTMVRSGRTSSAAALIGILSPCMLTVTACCLQGLALLLVAAAGGVAVGLL